MGSFSKNASRAVLPLALALGGVTCIAQSTEDSRLGAVAQPDTPKGTISTTTTVPQCNPDGGAGDGGPNAYLEAYLNALEGAPAPYWGSDLWGGYGGYGYEPSYTGWYGGVGYGGVGYGGVGYDGLGYDGLGYGVGYYGGPYGWRYGGSLPPEPVPCQ